MPLFVPDPKAVNVTKLEVARRQIAEAVRLFFERRDAVSIHTLTSAGHQVLADVGSRSGWAGIFRNEELIRPEKRSEWKQIINSAGNFFKHADKDPEDTLDFQADLTQHLLFDAVYLFRWLTADLFPEAMAFALWYVLRYPDALVDTEETKTWMRQVQSLGLRPNDFDRFREMINAAYADRNGVLPD